jgi:hypothetical protein
MRFFSRQPVGVAVGTLLSPRARAAARCGMPARRYLSMHAVVHGQRAASAAGRQKAKSQR